MSDAIKPAQRLWTGDYYNEGAGHADPFDTLREECGVFGVFGHAEAASLSYYGLHALQHRGKKARESAPPMGRTFITTAVWAWLRKCSTATSWLRCAGTVRSATSAIRRAETAS